MSVNYWEIILWNYRRPGSGFRREILAEINEERARAEARKRWSGDGWYVYNASRVRVEQVEQ